MGKCGRIFNFLKDIYLCRYIDNFLKEGYDIYEDFLEIPDDFFQQMNIPFLNKSQQQKFYNKLHLIQSKYKPKYLKNNILINQKENKINYNNYNIINNDNTNNNISNSHNNNGIIFSNNIVINEKKEEKITNNKKIIKDTSPFITQEDLMYKTVNDIDELEKQRSEDFKKEVEKWRNNNSSRPNTSSNHPNNKLLSEAGININISTQRKNKNDLYCWNCYKKFSKGEGISKEYNNNYDLNSKYNIKNFCTVKCKKDYEKKQRSQYMCFECRKMFDLMEGFIAFEGEKFCTNECKNKFIVEEKENIKNKKQNNIIKENNNICDKNNKNEKEEEEDIYDPMDDF